MNRSFEADLIAQRDKSDLNKLVAEALDRALAAEENPPILSEQQRVDYWNYVFEDLVIKLDEIAEFQLTSFKLWQEFGIGVSMDESALLARLGL